MNADQAISKMVAPSDRRPGIWRDGVMQINIARACDQQCFSCTQGSQLRGKPNLMTPDQFEECCKSLDGYFGVVGVFGGNPAVSKYFGEICEIMRRYIPFEQRGLWCNNPMGKGKIMRETFNPSVSNLNVHLVQTAYEEFARDWPECEPYLKGHDCDSLHAPCTVAMKDLDILPFPDGTRRENTEENRWDIISNCDVNRLWSSLFGVFRGQLRFWVCEIMGSHSVMHQDDPEYPDTGMKVDAGVWKHSIHHYADQIKFHCHSCGMPMKLKGELAIGGEKEYVTKTHASVFGPKDKSRPVVLVELATQLHGENVNKVTDYLPYGGA